MKELRDLKDFRGGYRSCPFSLPVHGLVFVFWGSVTSVGSEQGLVRELDYYHHGLTPCHFRRDGGQSKVVTTGKCFGS